MTRDLVVFGRSMPGAGYAIVIDQSTVDNSGLAWWKVREPAVA